MKYRIIKSQRYRDTGLGKSADIEDLQRIGTQHVLAKLIRWLRYGDVNVGNPDQIWHSLADVARLVGVPLGRVKNILSDPTKKRVKKAVKTGKRSETFTPSQLHYIVKHETLIKWASLSMKERVIELKKRYPLEIHSAY